MTGPNRNLCVPLKQAFWTVYKGSRRSGRARGHKQSRSQTYGIMQRHQVCLHHIWTSSVRTEAIIGNSRPDAASPTSWGPGLEPSWTSRLGLIAAEKATLSPTASQEESDGSDLIGWEAGTRDQPFSAKWVTLASDSATVARYYVHVRSRFSVPTPVACKSAISNTYFGAPEHVIGTVSRYSPSLDVDQSAANFQASCASPVSIGSVKDSFNLEQPCSKLQTEQVEMTPRPSSTTVCDVRAACLDLAQNKVRPLWLLITLH